ncbi:DNA alkylation repair protein [Myxococcota bacterium]|nr:DNA alkylation repair protein [Myxococcota bacterium]
MVKSTTTISMVTALKKIPPASYPDCAGRRRATVFLLLYEAPEPTILGIQKADHHGYPWRGQIAFPGGHIDPTDASPLEAAFREVHEEVNIPPEAITVATSLGHFATIKSLDIEAMAGFWDGSSDLRHDPAEIARIVQIPLATLHHIHLQKGYGGHIPDVAALTYPISDPGGDYTIWGVTARIIHHLLEHLDLPQITGSPEHTTQLFGDPMEKTQPPFTTLDPIIEHLKSLGDAERAASSQRFFKTKKGEYGHGDVFLGIRVPLLRKNATLLKAMPLDILEKLLQSPLHEARLLALFIMVKRFSPKRSTEREAIFRMYTSNTRFINNWDLVDSSAHLIMGAHLENSNKSLIYDFARSDDLWKKRISMIATFWYIKKNEFHDALAIATILIHDTHDLIHKAVGWMIREIGERDHGVEVSFLNQHYKTMPRTMLRYAIEKFPEDQRQAYLRGTI